MITKSRQHCRNKPTEREIERTSGVALRLHCLDNRHCFITKQPQQPKTKVKEGVFITICVIGTNVGDGVGCVSKLSCHISKCRDTVLHHQVPLFFESTFCVLYILHLLAVPQKETELSLPIKSSPLLIIQLKSLINIPSKELVHHHLPFFVFKPLPQSNLMGKRDLNTIPQRKHRRETAFIITLSQTNSLFHAILRKIKKNLMV
mmetsp:Transcript_35980/g.56276  ORF Transcript_35980/g.56276 Transcript_35980/m.56276 type:complete len:204 (-) Transcript_35980:2883-3494(-)